MPNPVTEMKKRLTASKSDIIDIISSRPDNPGLAAKRIVQMLQKHLAKLPSPRVLIMIDGGNLHSVIADASVDYKLKDWDNIIAGDALRYLSDADRFDPVEEKTPNAFTESVYADVEDNMYATITYQFSLKGWNGDTDDVDYLVKWVNAPNRDVLITFIKNYKLQVAGSIDALPKQYGIGDGVDCILDTRGNIIEGRIGETKLRKKK